MKRYVKGFEYIPLMIILIICYKLLNNFEIITNSYEVILGIMIPFLWAFTFAYLINPLMVWIEVKFKLRRILSIFISYLIVSIIVTIAVKFMFPEISKSATEIIKNMPRYLTDTEHLITQTANNYPEFFTKSNLSEPITTSIQNLTKFGANFFTALLSTAIGFANHVMKLAIGMIISIYFLLDKEKFILGFKKIIFGLFAEKTAKHIVDFGTDVNLMFSKFIVGKTIDSLIIGILAYFGMLFVSAPYPVLFAFIIGITNMIPFFGPFFGAIPVVIITLFYNPIIAVWTALFILLLQQFDGYILGPKILGDSVGLSPFWIILSILVGGTFFGVIGMLVAVPTTAVLRNRTIHYLDQALVKKNIKL